MISIYDLIGMLADYDLCEAIQVRHEDEGFSVETDGELSDCLSAREARNVIIESLESLAAENMLPAIDMLEMVEELNKREQDNEYR